MANTYPKTPDLNRRYVQLHMPDIGTAGAANGSVFFVPGYRGKIKKLTSVISAAIATTDTILTSSIGTTAVTGGAITIAFTGSAAGDVDTATPTAANSFSATDYIKVVSDGATSTTLPAVITLELEAT